MIARSSLVLLVTLVVAMLGPGTAHAQVVADLSLTKTDQPDPVRARQDLTYTLTVRNNGLTSASGVTVTDMLPANVVFVGASASQGTCARAGSTVTCNLGNLAGNAVATVTIVVRPTTVGTLQNSASVTANETDPAPENNADTESTTVQPNAAPGSDFNGDGFDDLVVRVPEEDLQHGGGNVADAGAVNVLYGSGAGIAAPGNQFWHQGVDGVDEDPETQDLFGNHAALAGDFDGNGYADLAVGVMGESVGPLQHAGAVNVLYGSAAGLTPAGSQLWTQESPDVPGTAQANELFGWALERGDFDGDGFHDLAIGTPEDTETGNPGGSLTVLRGSPAGLTASGAQLWTQDSPGIPGDSAGSEDFGFSLAAADFNADGFWDLAVGDPFDTAAAQANSGSVTILFGFVGGLQPVNSVVVTQDSPGVPERAESFDAFGWSLTAADFGSDSRPDLAIGVPFEIISGGREAGAVNVIYAAAAAQYFTQYQAGGIAEHGDAFAWSIASGNVGKGGKADLVVGAPAEDVGRVEDGGALNILYGSSTGLTKTGAQQISQNTAGVEDVSELFDFFGDYLFTGDFNADGTRDFAAGAPTDDFRASGVFGGVVNVFSGAANGPSGVNDQLWSQDRAGVEDQAEEFDLFGVDWTGFTAAAAAREATGAGRSAARAAIDRCERGSRCF